MSDTAVPYREGAPAEKRGQIHDQGYQRYTGERRPQARRFLVIARNVFEVAWKQKKGVRGPLYLTALTVIIAAAIMIALGEVASRMPARSGGFLPKADTVLLGAMSAFGLWGLILSTTAAAPAVADDLRSGAFQFYFSRPLHAGDYVRGKLFGLFLLVGVTTFAGPVLIALVRIAIISDWSQAGAVLPLLPKAIGIGFLHTAGLVLPAAAVGALLRKRTPAMAAWVVYMIVISNVFEGFAVVLEEPAIALGSMSACVTSLSMAALDVPVPRGTPPLELAVPMLLAMAAGSYLIIRWRVRWAENAGIGGV